MTGKKAASGGARRGAGRKPVPLDKRRGSRTITLSPDLLAVARRLGDGNVSAGVAVALSHFAAGPVPREVQIWRRVADGAHFVVLWQGGLLGATGPLSLAAAQAIRRGETPLPEQWDAALADALDAGWDAGEYEQVEGGTA